MTTEQRETLKGIVEQMKVQRQDLIDNDSEPFSMERWATSCGTVGCIGGSIAIRNGCDPGPSGIREALGLGYNESFENYGLRRVFYAKDWNELSRRNRNEVLGEFQYNMTKLQLKENLSPEDYRERAAWCLKNVTQRLRYLAAGVVSMYIDRAEQALRENNMYFLFK
jgi:hypothetical protein